MKYPNYTIVLQPDEDGWLAYIPALPACYAPGDTPVEALAELKIVFEMTREEYEEERLPFPELSPREGRT